MDDKYHRSPSRWNEWEHHNYYLSEMSFKSSKINTGKVYLKQNFILKECVVSGIYSTFKIDEQQTSLLHLSCVEYNQWSKNHGFESHLGHVGLFSPDWLLPWAGSVTAPVGKLGSQQSLIHTMDPSLRVLFKLPDQHHRCYSFSDG